MAALLDGTPRSQGYRMPAEFETHQQTWLLWPERPDNWRLGAKPAQAAFAAVIRAIARFEPVTVGVSAAQFSNARSLLPPEVRLVEMSSNDAWLRDTGCTFLVNDSGGLRAVDWRFNAWGGLVDGLYFPWDKDDQIAAKMCELERIDYYRPDDFVLEGGSFHVDGQGTVVVTESCLLSPGRNPHLDKAAIEQRLKDYLGCTTVLWLPRGIYRDETNEHVDNIFHFVEPGVAVLAWTDNQADPQYALSRQSLDYLESVRDAAGRKLTVHKLHLPDPVCITAEEAAGVDQAAGTLPRQAGDRQAASYANYYICNGALIVPVFGDREHDERALDLLAALYKTRQVVPVYAREILLGGGNIHCITQQQPLALGR